MQNNESFNKGIIEILKRIVSRPDSVIRFNDIANNERNNIYEYNIYIDGTLVFTISDENGNFNIKINHDSKYQYLDISGHPKYVDEFMKFVRDLCDAKNKEIDEKAVNNMMNFLKQFDK